MVRTNKLATSVTKLFTCVVAGDLTTYYVKLSDAFVTQVNNLVTDVASLFVLTTYLQLEFDAIKDTMTTVTGTGQAVVTLDVGYCTGAIIDNAGAGYAVNDILTVVGGTGTATEITVVNVSAGNITKYYISNPGSYSLLPSNAVTTTTGGGGVGATFNLYWNQNFNVDVPTTKFGVVTDTNANIELVDTVYPLTGALTITSTGTYMYWYAADALLDATAENIGVYYPIKNAVDSNIDSGSQTGLLTADAGTVISSQPQKLALTGIFTATAADEITIVAKMSTIGGDIAVPNGQLTVIKVA